METRAQEWRFELAREIERQAFPVEKFGHQPRLYALTKQVGAGLEYDDDVVYAAVFTHDLGVFVGHRPEDPKLLPSWDMIAYAVAKVPAMLQEVGFPDAKIEAVIECIKTHQPGFVPKTMEATILRDADILEQLGAVGILRTVCKVGRDTRFDTFTLAVRSLQKTLDSLPSLIVLPSTKTLAEPRVEILRSWLAAVTSEAGALLL